jgi:hypothetical protein
MNINELKNSRFLKKEDCDPPLTVTIDHVEQQNAAELGEKPEYKFCLFFRGNIKPMVLNPTNGKLIARALGSKESDNWVGKDIELFHDRNVTYGGQLTGGIRVRPARTTENAVAEQESEPFSGETDNGFDLDQYSDERLRDPEVVSEIRKLIDNLPVSNADKANQFRYLNQLVRRAKANAPTTMLRALIKTEKGGEQ